MLDKDSVLNTHNICGNPIHKSTETAKSPGVPIRFRACIPSVTSRPASVFVKFDM
jgi:hypothetical protein